MGEFFRVTIQNFLQGDASHDLLRSGLYHVVTVPQNQKDQCDLVRLENLNLRAASTKDIFDYIQEKYPDLMLPYNAIYNKGDRSYFRGLEEQAEHLAKEYGCLFVDNELHYVRAEPRSSGHCGSFFHR